MKKFGVLFLALVILSMTTGCLEKVPYGYQGILVNLLGGDKGVTPEQVPVGRIWVGLNQDLFLFPTFLQNYVWSQSAEEGKAVNEGIDVQTQEGMAVGLDVGISYHFDPEKIPSIFKQFMKGPDEIRDIYMRNTVRNALVKSASSYTVEQIYGPGKADFLSKAQQFAKDDSDPKGIIIDKLFLTGQMRLPAQVVAALNAKIQMTQEAQKAENQVKQAEAIAKQQVATAEGNAKSVLINAEAQAKSNQILNASLTPTLVEYIKANKWNGQLPQVTGGATPIIDMRTK
jgi:regulator of protease activity HflC (stomatin/prohibitin superfamily)